MEKVTYAGIKNCYRLSNGKIELIVTGDLGPRIIRFGLVGQGNLLKEYPDEIASIKPDQWQNFGGHRLWHAPEAKPRTYFPDNEPVFVQEIPNGLVATQKPEPTTGLQKQIEIKLSPDKLEVQLQHVLINHNLWAIETAPWAITVMAPGGVAVLPLPPRGPQPENLVPTGILALWPYTDLTDPRWLLGQRFILASQDQALPSPQKMGVFVSDGWAAYANQNCLLVKQTPLQLDGVYPDRGVNFEVYIDETMLELESLGPIESIPPRGQIDHLERWTLFEGVPQPATEADVIRNILPLLGK